jgi:hypothetical protein
VWRPSSRLLPPLVVAVTLVGAACGACLPDAAPQAPPPAQACPKPPAPPPPSTGGLTADDRLAVFEALRAEIRAVHQPSPSKWDALAPLTFAEATGDLRDDFANATTDADLDAVLTRFGNSLHDAHGGFLPAVPVHVHLALPLVIAPEWDGTTLRMVVTESRAKGVDPGDVLTSYAGVPASAFLTAYADRSSASQWRGIAIGIAEWMTERPADSGDGADGRTVTLGLQKREGPETLANVTWSRGGWHGEGSTDRQTPEYDRLRCAPWLPSRKYPAYELASHSARCCLYTSKSPRYAPYPILRFFSFDFRSSFEAEAEYDHIARALKALPQAAGGGGGGIKALLMDLRDNGGGSDPSWVLDWFAPRSYLDLRTQVKKTRYIDTLVLEDVAVLDDGWVNALVHAEDGALVSRFLGCKSADCSDTRRQPKHRILPVPVALMVGPRCDGSCDHFARVWFENGLGPLVGESTGGSLSELRLDYPIVARNGRRLGAMRIAISLDYSPFTQLPVEGRPLHVDVPVSWSWDKRESYDAAMVDAAIGALAK